MRNEIEKNTRNRVEEDFRVPNWVKITLLNAFCTLRWYSTDLREIDDALYARNDFNTYFALWKKREKAPALTRVIR